MIVDAKVFMDLVARQARMESELRFKISRLEERIETLEKRPIILEEAKEASKSTDEMAKLYHEMTNGTVDERAGRVIYTDGRD